jgi:hypothetical protein
MRRERAQVDRARAAVIREQAKAERARYRKEHAVEIKSAQRLREKARIEANKDFFLERDRLAKRKFRALHPDRKREQDRRYREKNRAKVRAYKKLYRKHYKPPPGYRYIPSPRARETIRQYAKGQNLKVTAAAQYLRSIGVLEWWGPQETTRERRMAAYAYVRKIGLMP